MSAILSLGGSICTSGYNIACNVSQACWQEDVIVQQDERSECSLGPEQANASIVLDFIVCYLSIDCLNEDRDFENLWEDYSKAPGRMIAIDLPARCSCVCLLARKAKAAKKKRRVPTSFASCKCSLFFLGAAGSRQIQRKKGRISPCLVPNIVLYACAVFCRTKKLAKCTRTAVRSQHRVVCLRCLLQDKKAGKMHKDSCPLQEYLLFACSNWYLLQDKSSKKTGMS